MTSYNLTKWVLNQSGNWVKSGNDNKIINLINFAGLGNDVNKIINSFKMDLDQNEINKKNRRSICYIINMVCFGNFKSPPYLYRDFGYYQYTIMDKDNQDFWVKENKIDLDNEIRTYKKVGNIQSHKRNNNFSCVYSNKNNVSSKRLIEVYGNNGEGVISDFRLSIKLLDKLDNGGEIVIKNPGLNLKNTICFEGMNMGFRSKIKKYIIMRNRLMKNGKRKKGVIVRTIRPGDYRTYDL